MPFDPKLIRAEEPPVADGGDLNLPSDLAALADQLRDDATHLAASYPPSVAPRTTTLRPSRTAALIASATAATLAALLAGFVVFWQRPEANRQEHSFAPSTPSQFFSTAVPSDNTISFTELSSPELEAFVDLMERSPDNTLRVSF